MSGKKRGLQTNRSPLSGLKVGEGEQEQRDHPFAGKPGLDRKSLRVPIGLVSPDPNQPRKEITPESVKRLADDIKAHGLLNPITVVKEPGEEAEATYRIVAGGRRFAALQLLEVQDVPVRVVSPDSVRVVQLAENLQRQDLPVIEEAYALRELQGELGASIRELADRLHLSRGYVERRLRVPDWPTELQEALKEHPGWFSRLDQIAGLNDEAEQQRQLATLKGEPVKAAPREKNSSSAKGRPVNPFNLKEMKNGGFNLTVKFRPGKTSREELIEKLRGVLAKLEAPEK